MSSATQTLDKTASDQSWIAWSAILSGLVRAFAWSSPSFMEVTKRTRELWYQGRGRVMASEYSGKFWMIADAISRNRTRRMLTQRPGEWAWLY